MFFVRGCVAPYFRHRFFIKTLLLMVRTMKIVAIDAGRGNGTVSQTLLAVAQSAQEVGAETVYIRLADYRIRDCVNCKLCALGEGCKIEDDMAELSALITQADGVIIGAPSRERGIKSDHRAFDAMMLRLRTYFEGNRNQPRLPGFGSADAYLTQVARATKRAIVITSSGGPGGIGAFFATGDGQVRNLRRALAACYINAVGSLSVRRETRRGEELSHEQWDRAASLGRLIAGKL